MRGKILPGGPEPVLSWLSGEMSAKETASDPEAHLDILQALISIRQSRRLYPAVAHAIQKKLGVPNVALFLYHPETGSFSLELAQGDQVPDDLLDTFNSYALLPGMHHSLQQGGSVCSEIRSRFLPDILGNPGSSPNQGRSRAVLGVPLLAHDHLVGILSVGRKSNGDTLSGAEEEFLKRLGVYVAVCIDNCLRRDREEKEKLALRNTLNNLSLLYGIGQAITRIADLKSLLKYILDQAIKISRVEKGSIMLYEAEKNRLFVRVITGMADTASQEKINNLEISCRSFAPGEGIAGKVFQTNKPWVVNNVEKSPDFTRGDSSFVRSLACIPMRVHGEVLGVINLTNKLDPEGFSDEDIDMLKAVADQAAIAINKAQLWEMAFTDSLTGLYDRRYFKVKLHEERQRAIRYNKPFSIVIADLDKFKDVNDQYGHAEGDRVLKEIGAFMKTHIRNVDMVARYGGDEFILFLPEKGKSAANLLSERLKKRICRESLNASPSVSISFGIASFPEDGTEIDDLIHKADQAMYYAKQVGGNRVAWYENGQALV